MRRTSLLAACLSLLGLLPAFAASTTADLNLRAGPGTGFAVIGVMPRGADVNVGACDNSGWCSVSYQGRDGFAFGRYLAEDGATTLALLPREAVPTAGGFNHDPVPRAESHGLVHYLGAGVGPNATVATRLQRGSVLPANVPLAHAPGGKYAYVIANGRPVLVDPNTRQVLYTYP